ncbi:MAG: motility protein MotB [Gallionellales bacterium CG_4_10_14_3_um_filter_54_96]|nr:MAG: flagellar motor protein MotB [Gallionellaceae bacterium CG1_02_56_997]PIV91789.1 MAG: motility protein MotB [Gallionellales bacterium CG17_big_fil_post_rev_8_21_14_2_50_54_146]PIX04969.1 MAG: motility protein MotB [Gallionellales bacterium CG_4_8_14_3_um_filter_54_18]PIY03606.1 MAG: motility protein MotB [Gallionellales bacterium CG_4_10_14_3_um_filter_54_96]PJC04281.1 MAG: motility protein MotB [Gallionellales bacterium CG_4_9_14_0_8_um_filter_55_61]HCJ51634.1 motility protein MotB [G
MAEDLSKRPIVIKRIKKVAAGAHGGAWKIAYADFVTAMMAFFLLMWLLGSTSKGDLKGISDYFKTPLKVALAGGSGSGDSSSILKGGGKDLTRSEGQVKSGDLPTEKRIINLKAAQQEFKRAEAEKLKDLKSSIEKAIENNAQLKQFKNQILLDITTEGLRIQIVDEQNRPMFQSGRAQLEPYTREILHAIGQTLNDVPNKVSISGHTDAALYGGGNKGYSNWELSADRANASRRELIAGGMADDKIVRVVGLSSAVLFDKEQPLDPSNRRISLIIMNKKAEEAAGHDGGVVGVDAEDDEQDIKQSIQEGAAKLPAIRPRH